MSSPALDSEQSQAIPMPLVAGEDARDEEEVGRGPSGGAGSLRVVLMLTVSEKNSQKNISQGSFSCRRMFKCSVLVPLFLGSLCSNASCNVLLAEKNGRSVFQATKAHEAEQSA